MPFVTLEDLHLFFSAEEITSLLQSNVDVTATLLALNAEVEAYLLAAGSRPYTSTDNAPLVVKQAAADIARFRLYKDSAPEVVIERWKAATRWLEAVAAGKVLIPQLNDPNTPDDESGAPGAEMVEEAERLMTRTQFLGW